MNFDSTEKAYGLIRAYLQSLHKPTVLELGMCDGYHTNMLLGWCAEPTYIGFEPDPRNVQKIIGAGLDQRISFYPAAMGNVTGSVTFHISAIKYYGSGSISEFTPELDRAFPGLVEEGQATVPSWRLDDFVEQRGIRSIDFIWMDVQGAERLVFEGAQKALPHVGMIWTEYDSGILYKDSSTLADILKWFPGWTVLADCGGDVLLQNPDYVRNPVLT